MSKWFYLGLDGNIQVAGEFTNFEDASAALDGLYVWLFDEATAREWTAVLNKELAA